MISKLTLLFLLAISIGIHDSYAQNVEVDVNLNIKHSVGGISDFGRDRHITVHSSLTEKDWDGEEDKLKYLLDDLDVYLGRDNGSASWKFQYSKADESRPNHADLADLVNFGNWCKNTYEHDIDSTGRDRFEYRAEEMIHGTNPHPTYPTLSYNHYCGVVGGTQWFPQDIETSAEWMVEYLDKFFVETAIDSGEPRPLYWEVINEPDMILNTGKFMMSSWEDVWEYHNLVAEGIRGRLGDKAPLIGGMTWGLHDFYERDLGQRYPNFGYTDGFYGSTPGDEVAKAYAREQTTSTFWPTGITNDWYQWDVIWKGFVDSAGANMDFYSVHLYDWPTYNASGGKIRTGGHTEAALEMLEWYDVNKFGKENRKPIVISEYGAVQGAWDYLSHDVRYDWECLKPFSSMLMQFLERPDYIVKSMPFTPIKAEWWKDAYGVDYHYRLLTQGAGSSWVWTDYIKWYKLWSDVKGTRVDTKSSDLDIQVDAYVNGNHVYLILNNLEPTEKSIDLNLFGDASGDLLSVRLKHLYLDESIGTGGQTMLSDVVYSGAPEVVTIGAEATMILDYKYSESLVIGESSDEEKYYGPSLSGTVPNRKTVSDDTLTVQIDGVQVPSGEKEVTLRICGKFFYIHVTNNDGRNGVTFNGHKLNVNTDWRGEAQGDKYFGVLEIDVPGEYLQENNTIKSRLLSTSEYTNVSLQVFDFSTAPGRTDTTSSVSVTGISGLPATAELGVGSSIGLAAKVSPANATNRKIIWSSNSSSTATVDQNGVVKGISAGTATITATTEDGSFTDECVVTVSANLTINVEGIALSPSTVNLKVGEKVKLYKDIEPVNASNQAVTWSSDNAAVVSVSDNGIVSGKAIGSALITVTTDDGSYSATCAVVVTGDVVIDVTGVVVSPKASTLMVGETLTLSATVSPGNASNQTVSWSSDNTTVATVSASGEVTTLAEGIANITVSTNDGGFEDVALITVSGHTDIKQYFALDNLAIYPSNADEYIRIQGLKNIPHDVSIYNIQGVELMHVEELSGFNNTIYIERLPVGYYVVNINNGKASGNLSFYKIR